MIEELLAFISREIANHGYVIVFVAMFLENASGIGTLIPGDTTLMVIGFYAHSTDLSLLLLILAGITGAVIGDNLSYLVGRKGGRALVGRLERRWPALGRRLTDAQKYFKRHGGKTVLFGRNIALVRTYIPLLAGAGKMSYSKFFVYNIIGAALQITAFLLVGYFFGQYRDTIEKVLKGGGLVLVVLAVIIFVIYRRRKRRAKT